MKSKITIEVDFDNNNLPIIQVIQRESDDVRDRLLSQFTQNLNHISRWARLIYVGEQWNDQQAGQVWKIEPIIPSEIRVEMNLMKAVLTAGEPVGSSGDNQDSIFFDLQQQVEYWKAKHDAIANSLMQENEALRGKSHN